MSIERGLSPKEMGIKPEEMEIAVSPEKEKREREIEIKEEKCKEGVESRIEELNQELFNGEEILIAKDASYRIVGMAGLILDENKNEDFIIKEALAREISEAISKLERRKEGIDPEGGFSELLKIRAQQREGKIVEPLIDLQEADEKIKKLQQKLGEIRGEIGGW